MTPPDLRIKLGCRFQFELPQPTPMIALLNVHFSRVSDLEYPDHLTTSPCVPMSGYRDGFGNWCTRLIAPQGRFTVETQTIIRDTGLPDARPDIGARPPLRRCRTRCSSIFWAAGIATPIHCPTRLGACFSTHPPGYRAFRRSAISFTTISVSITLLRTPPAAPHRPITMRRASVAITRIWRSPFAAV